MTAVALDDIRVGDRHRHDLGDIKTLAESMVEVGLLHPVVVTADYRLIAGQRRIVAARRLGWNTIDITVATSITEAGVMLAAERDENTCRKAFTPTEEHAVYEAVLALEKPKAAERQGTRTDLSTSEKVSQKSSPQPQRSKEAAAKAASGSAGRARTLDKVGETKALAVDQSKPEPVREAAKQALNDMDRTGKVDRAHQAARRAAEQPTDNPRDEWITNNTDYKRVDYNARLARAIKQAGGLLAFTDDDLSAYADHELLDSLDSLARDLTTKNANVRRHRSGLRLAGGTR